MEQKYKGLAPALERGLEIIELVSAVDEPLSFTYLEQMSGIPKATLSRLLKVLCGMNYLAKSPDAKYIPGSRCGMIGRPDSTEAEMLQYGPELVREVCRLTANTCILLYWDGKQTRVAVKEMHAMSLSMQPPGNVSVDYHATPWGWIFLGSPELSPDIKLTVDTLKYRKNLDFYREHGFMLDQQDNLCRLAVPVCAGSRTVGALGLGMSISAPSDDLIISYGRILMDYAAILSKKLSLTA